MPLSSPGPSNAADGSASVGSSIADTPGLWLDDNAPTFAEPWQAHAFAMTVKLHEQGVFTWQEWADALSKKISLQDQQNHQDQENGPAADVSQRVFQEAYFLAWLAALESLLIDKNILNQQEMVNMKTNWKEAYETTPHGQPVKL